MTDDFEVTPAQRAYLLAFDNWLHTNWKRYTRPVVNAATELKDACLSEVMKEAGVNDVPKDPMQRLRHPPGSAGPPATHCGRCGTDLPGNTGGFGKGRPRKYCFDCRPSRVAA